jgi:hypothetical protein
MGGRVYDPNIGRFLSADLFVQSPYSSQSFNRYSYVGNNPMSRVDPTGYQAVDELVVTASRWNAFDNTGDHMTGSFGVGREQPMPGGHDVEPIDPEVLKAIGDISGGIIGVDQSSGGLVVQASDGSKWVVKVGGQTGGKGINGSGLSAKEAFEHYKGGSGTPKRISFDQVDTSGVSAKDFKAIKDLLTGKQPGTASVDGKLVLTTSGDNFLMLGNITLRLQGSLSITEKDWSFNGSLKSYDDMYDFNASSHRSVIGELLTTFGRNTEGTPFPIEIRGDKPMVDSGSF